MSSGDLSFRRRWSGDKEILPTEFRWNGRPLVVIDPEDREQVERLYHLYASAPTDVGLTGSHFLEHALREFANPKPPKPEEPTGLGAVVEDADGSLLIRNAPSGSRPWVTIHGATFDWADIDVARIHSEGVAL